MEELLEKIPFAAQLAMQVSAADAAEVHGSMPWSPNRCTAEGVLHGGALMAFADTLAALCAYLNLPEGAGTATVESKTNFFRAVRNAAQSRR